MMRGDSGGDPSSCAMFFRTPGGSIGRRGFCFGARRGAEDVEGFSRSGGRLSRPQMTGPHSVQVRQGPKLAGSGCLAPLLGLGAAGKRRTSRKSIPPLQGEGVFERDCAGGTISLEHEAGGGVSPPAREGHLSNRDTPPSGLRPATSPCREERAPLCPKQPLRSPRLCAKLPREGLGTAKPQSPSFPPPPRPAGVSPASLVARYW